MTSAVAAADLLHMCALTWEWEGAMAQ